MAIFGYNTIGGTTGGIFTDQSFIGTRFTAPADGTITKIWFYGVASFAGSPVDFHAGVYSVTGTSPGTLLASSASPGTLGLSFGWYSCDVSLSITNGTEYYLAVWPSDVYEIKYDAGAADQSFEKYNQTYSTWETPINTGADFNSYGTEVSIYAEYTPAGGGPLQVTAWLTA